MQFALQNNIEKQRKDNAKAIPQVSLAAQNKTQKGRYFLEGSNTTNATTVDNPSAWQEEFSKTIVPYKSIIIRINQSGTDAPVFTVLFNNSDINSSSIGTYYGGAGYYPITGLEGVDIDQISTTVTVRDDGSGVVGAITPVQGDEWELYGFNDYYTTTSDDILDYSILEIKIYS